MSIRRALFSDLLGEQAWDGLPHAVRAMHGAEPRLVAEGVADVEGANRLAARLLRRLLGVPRPGPAKHIRIVIERGARCEVWTRKYDRGVMQSRLEMSGSNPPLLREQLGPVAMEFALHADAKGIDWLLERTRFLGLPFPRALLGRVSARCESRDGRYWFHIDTRLPLLGKLIAYHGWLECIDDA